MRHIPNILTCLRILMVIAFIILFVHAKYLICLILYLAAFFTDILDGYLARRFNWVSDFGKLVDPFADKFMLISALICLCAVGAFPLYLLAILIVKEIVLITGGVKITIRNLLTIIRRFQHLMHLNQAQMTSSWEILLLK